METITNWFSLDIAKLILNDHLDFLQRKEEQLDVIIEAFL